MPTELPIIQKTYDLIRWYVPILNKLPRDHRFQLGDRLITGLYDLLESLIRVRYEREKLPHLRQINSQLDVLRYQTRLLLDFDLLSHKRYQYVGQMMNSEVPPKIRTALRERKLGSTGGKHHGKQAKELQ